MTLPEAVWESKIRVEQTRREKGETIWVAIYEVPVKEFLTRPVFKSGRHFGLDMRIYLVPSDTEG